MELVDYEVPGHMDDEFEEDAALVLMLQHQLTVLHMWRRQRRRKGHARRRGSVPGRRPNKNRDFAAGLANIRRDYFGLDGRPPVYDEQDFVRRFRVPRAVFMRIYNDLKDRRWWAQRPNATGRPQAHPLQKLVAAFRIFAYGESFDSVDEYVRLSKSTVHEATNRLVAFILRTYQPFYLRAPTHEDLKRIMTRNAARGLPGCMGSLDCSHWAWTNCPTEHAGMYKGRHKHPNIVLETVCDEDMWVWHMFAGSPGSNNDVNVLSHSPLMVKVSQGDWPPRDLAYTVNGEEMHLPYYLVDGIYPRYAFFVSPHPMPTTPQQKAFNRVQEGIRKDVERLYAVLTARFHVALHPARAYSVPSLICTAKAITVLHNMVTEHRREGYVSRTRSGYDEGGGQGAQGVCGSGGGGGGNEGGGGGGGGVGDDDGGDGDGGCDDDDGDDDVDDASREGGDDRGRGDDDGDDDGGSDGGDDGGGGDAAGSGDGGVGGCSGAGSGEGGEGELPAGGGAVQPIAGAPANPAYGGLMRAIVGWVRATNVDGHERLRDALTAHVWEQRHGSGEEDTE